MITPPFGTSSSYTAAFEKSAAHLVAGLVAKEAARDIEQVFVTSLDMGSDVQAANELEQAITGLSADLLDEGESFDTVQKFNPLYLPRNKVDLIDLVDIDMNGDINAIDGFGNPFISMSLRLSTEEHKNMLSGVVSYSQFLLPPVHELLQTKNQPLS